MIRPNEILFTPNEIPRRIGEQPESALSDILSRFPEVDRSSLLKQLSLHLPQYSLSENLSPHFIRDEAGRLASRLQSLRKADWENVPLSDEAAISPQNLYFDQVDETTAKSILEHFHYLLSFREQSVHLGVKISQRDRWPVAMVTLSPFDLANIQSSLPLVNGHEASPLVLSRAFAFDCAPRNTMSYLLSRCRGWIAVNMPEVNILVTYLNPNVGFTGASYRADNWILLGREEGTRYFYVNRNYVTDRWIYNQFGQAPMDMKESWKTYGISVSIHRLFALELYVRAIVTPKRKWHLRESKFPRWTPVGGRVS